MDNIKVDNAFTIDGDRVYRKTTEQVDGAGRKVHTPHVIAGSAAVAAPPMAVTVGAYVAGDCIGGAQELTDVARIAGGVTRLETMTLRDKSSQTIGAYIVFFDAEPADSTLTDHAAAVIHANDVSKVIGAVEVLASDWGQVDATLMVATLPWDRGIALRPATGTSLWMAVIAKTAPNFALVDDFSATFVFDQY
jgi:hypothetical protein